MRVSCLLGGDGLGLAVGDDEVDARLEFDGLAVHHHRDGALEARTIAAGAEALGRQDDRCSAGRREDHAVGEHFVQFVHRDAGFLRFLGGRFLCHSFNLSRN